MLNTIALSIIMFFFVVDIDQSAKPSSSPTIISGTYLNPVSNSTINCMGTEYCHVLCHTTRSCKYATIDASFANTVLIECKASESCQNAVINATGATSVVLDCQYDGGSTASTTGPCIRLKLYTYYSKSVEIDCNGWDTCHYASFYLKNSSNVSVNALTKYALDSADIYADSIETNLIVNCQLDYSCQYITVRATSFTMNCIGEGSCYSSHVACVGDGLCNVKCSGLTSCVGVSFSVNNRFSNLNLDCSGNTCSGSTTFCRDTFLSSNLYSNGTCKGATYDCCPFIDGSITCPAESDCYIDCRIQSCVNHFIDATNTNSLTIDCVTTSKIIGRSDGCTSAVIQCPLTNNSSCIINCEEFGSCKHLYVQTGNSAYNNSIHHFEMNCEGDSSCNYVTIDLYATIIDTFNILCIGSDSCSGNGQGVSMPVSVTSNNNINGKIGSFSLICDSTSSCVGFSVNTQYVVNNLTMICNGDCSQINISAAIDNYALISCTNTSSCQNSFFTLFSTEANIDIYCRGYNSSNDHGTCLDSYFYILGNSHNISVACGKYDCIQTEFHFNEADAVDIICNGSESCNGMIVDAMETNKVFLKCMEFKSCQSSIVYCPSYNPFVCDIECSSDSFSCSDMGIYVSDSYKYNYLKLICPLQDIHSVYLSACYKLEFICIGLRNVTPASLVYNYDTNIYECANYSDLYCCPFNYSNIDIPYNPTKSINPTITHIPNVIEPTIAPQIKNPIQTQDITTVDVNNNSNLSQLYTYIALIIAFSFLLVGVTGWIDSFYFHKNDIFQIGYVIVFGFYTMDFISDIFFAANVFTEKHLILFTCSCVFLLLPIILNLMELRKAINHWMVDKENGLFIINYMKRYTKFLYALSMISGSGFAATKLVNSCFCRFNIFDMGLKYHQMIEFQNKRFFAVVLAENIPQIGLQIAFIAVAEQFSGIPIMSLIFSVFSIVLSIFEYSTQRTLVKQQSANCNIYSIKFDVISKDVLTNRESLRYQKSKLNKKIAEMLNIDKLFVEQLRPIDINDGLQLMFRIRINKKDKKINNNNSNVDNTISDSVKNGSMVEYVKISWGLANYPIIQNLDIDIIQTDNYENNYVELHDYMLLED
eukprot:76586_1